MNKTGRVYTQYFNSVCPTLKRFSFGITSYATVVDYGFADDTADGLGITFKAALVPLRNSHLGVIANFASLEHTDMSSITVESFDTSIIWGNKLTKTGFGGYFGAGVFNEKWSGGGGSHTFSGGQFTMGIGYNFERFGIELFLNLRPTDAYEIGGNTPDTAGSAGLSFSLRL